MNVCAKFEGITKGVSEYCSQKNGTANKKAWLESWSRHNKDVFLVWEKK